MQNNHVYGSSRKVSTTYFLPFDSSYNEQSQEVDRLFPLVSSLRTLAKSIAKTVSKRQRPKGVEKSWLMQNLHTNLSASAPCDRLSHRRRSEFDDTWARPYVAGIERANGKKNCLNKNYVGATGVEVEHTVEYVSKNKDNAKHDHDSIFCLSSSDQSRDEVDETDYLVSNFKASDVDSMVSAVSEDEVSLYCDALSRKNSFVRITQFPMFANFNYLRYLCNNNIHCRSTKNLTRMPYFVTS